MLALLSFVSLGGSALAGAILRRADVACQTIHTGSLGLFSQSPPSATNVSLAFTSQASAYLAASDAESSVFAFQQCNSSFMGYQQTTDGSSVTSYGHIVPVNPNESDACLSTGGPTSAGSPYFIFNNECFYEDDDSQLGQYWSLTVDDVSGTMEVAFVGISASGSTIGDDGDISYTFVIDTHFDTEGVAVAASTLPDVPSLYTLQFID